ncbi:MAG: DNA-binding protein [Anaerobacillus sp.]|uniref:DNA-binding protein n=1 Tax=Anaerobacillus sp. TaxID=1872506 RepID=UPI00391BC8F7
MKTTEQYPMILTEKEISDILKVSKPTAYEVLENRDFSLKRIGRCERVMRNPFND